MPDNNFKIVISGDAAQLKKVLKDVKVDFAGVQAPVDKTAKSVNKLVRNSGISIIGKELKNTAGIASDFTRTIENILPPLGELAAFGTVAGLAALTYKFGELARSMQLASQYTGMSAHSLENWEGAGRAAGLAAGAMTDTMVQFSDEIEGAAYGRNPQLFNLAQRFHIELKDENGMPLDPDKVLNQVAEAISQEPNPKIKSAIINAFGLGNIKALLIEGAAGLEHLKKVSRETGFDQSDADLSKGAAFQKQLLESKLAAEGLANTIGTELIPIFQPLLKGFYDWEVANHGAFGAEVKKDVIELKNAIMSIASVISESVKSIGGWKTAFELLEFYIVGTFIKNINAAFVMSPIGRAFLAGELIANHEAIATEINKTDIGKKIGDGLMAVSDFFSNTDLSGAGDLGEKDGNIFSPVSDADMKWGHPDADWPTPAATDPLLGVAEPPSLFAPAAAPSLFSTLDAQNNNDPARVDLHVNFNNPPRGLTTSTVTQGDVNVKTNVGAAMPEGINN